MRVLALVAHPDDESLIAGGTLALAARAGAETVILSLTRGDAGQISDPALASPESLPFVREAELSAAAKILGASRTICFDLPDGEIDDTPEEDTADRVLDSLKGELPDVILSFGEDGLYWHPDHIAAHRIAHLVGQRAGADVLESVVPLGAMPALVEAMREQGLGVDLFNIEAEAFGTDAHPDLSVDILDVLGLKLAALRAHRTQLGPGHLLTGLPRAVAAEHLGSELWAGPTRRLAELLAQ